MAEFQVTWSASDFTSKQTTRMSASNDTNARRLVTSQYGHLANFRILSCSYLSQPSGGGGISSSENENVMGDLTFSLLGRAGKALFNKFVETEDSDIYEDDDEATNYIEDDSVSSDENDDYTIEYIYNSKILIAIDYVCTKVWDQINDSKESEYEVISDISEALEDSGLAPYLELIVAFCERKNAGEFAEDGFEQFIDDPLDLFGLTKAEALDLLKAGVGFLSTNGLISNAIGRQEEAVKMSNKHNYTDKLESLLDTCHEIGCFYEAITVLTGLIEQESED